MTKAAVMTKFGHAFSAHCPSHVRPTSANGQKYTMGHCSPSGPRAPTRVTHQRRRDDASAVPGNHLPLEVSHGDYSQNRGRG